MGTTLSLPVYDPRRAVSRLVLGLVAAVLAARSFGRHGWMERTVAGWGAFCVVELILGWWILASCGPVETARWVDEEDPGRTGTTFVVAFASFFNLLLAVYLLRHFARLGHEATLTLVALCLAAVAGSWLMTHTVFTAHYARRYYRHGGGLTFPEKVHPDFWDFAYFAFTIGMCFQVSDVTISDAHLRRVALGHSLISFALNTTILALAMNAVAELGT
jgi:uncharacterized membrane protein